jgi:hypothetical protein
MSTFIDIVYPQDETTMSPVEMGGGTIPFTPVGTQAEGGDTTVTNIQTEAAVVPGDISENVDSPIDEPAAPTPPVSPPLDVDSVNAEAELWLSAFDLMSRRLREPVTLDGHIEPWEVNDSLIGSLADVIGVHFPAIGSRADSELVASLCHQFYGDHGTLLPNAPSGEFTDVEYGEIEMPVEDVSV